MGGSNSTDTIPSFDYGLSITTPQPGETGIIRHPSNTEEFVTSLDGIETLQDVAQNSFAKFANNPFLGTNIDGVYQWKTYQEIQELSTALGSAIIQHQFLGQTSYNGQDFRCIGIYSKNREEWVISDLAAILYNFSLVPFFDSLGAESLEHICAQTEITSIIVSGENVLKILVKKRSGKTGNLLNIISMDRVSEEIASQAQQLGLLLCYIGDLYESGRNSKLEYIPTTPDSCFTISYTSGTTGLPKGVIMSHRNFVSKIFNWSKEFELYQDDVCLSYLPLPHIYERTVMLQLLYFGCSTGFYSGDVMKLTSDMQVLRPTLLPCVPRLLNKFADVIKAKFAQLPEPLAKVYKAAVNTKLEQLKYGKFDHPFYDALFFNNVKQMVGGRVRIIGTAAAAIKAETQNFIKIVFCCNTSEGYGQTETGGNGTSTDIRDPFVGTVGGTRKGIEMKLMDIPEMNYLTTYIDSEGILKPRGEVCFRGPTTFLGYFKAPEITAETIDSDGWVHTGDVGELQPNYTLKIIDRKKNLFKLSQGEYIAPERIENIHMLSPYVAMSFVHGDATRDELISIIVPDEAVVLSWAQKNGIEGDFEQLCENQQLYEEILRDLTELGVEYGLMSYERVRRIYLEKETFTIDKGLLTPTMKLVRFAAREYYKDIIARLYG